MVASEEEEKEEAKNLREEEETTLEENELELSLNSSSIVGLSNPKTIKFLGTIKGQKVVILLDSGVTHNFMFQKLVTKLPLPVSFVKFAVTLGDK